MSAQLKDRETERVQMRCQDWADWVNSDYLSGLGYPSSTSEARAIYGASPAGLKLEAIRWQAKAKSSRCAKIALPDWKTELLMDSLINALPTELQRVIYCRYEVRVKPGHIEPLNLDIRRMHLFGYDGRYNWPRYQASRIAVLRGMTSSTFYRSLDWAHKALIDSPGYYSVR